MGNMGDMFRRMREKREQRKGQRAFRAIATCPMARRLAFAEKHELVLNQCVPGSHYQLRVYGTGVYDSGMFRWCYNLYPITQRIYIDPKHRGPRLKVPRPWGLLDVVHAAIQAKRESEVTP